RARRRAAAALFGDAWRHRCLQRQDDRAAEAMVAGPGTHAAERGTPPPGRVGTRCSRGEAIGRHAISSSPAARHVRSLPQARAGDTHLAGIAFCNWRLKPWSYIAGWESN